MTYKKVTRALIVLALVAVLILVIRVLITGNSRYGYLPTNLFLAFVPLALSSSALVTKDSRQRAILLLLWLLFLPNAFYIYTDLIHLNPNEVASLDMVTDAEYVGTVSEVGIVFDAGLIFYYSVLGFAVGIVSVLQVRATIPLKGMYRNLVMHGVFILAALAVYMGRFLRWNSWDPFTQPAAVISDTVSSLASRHELLTVLMTYILISVSYETVRYLMPSVEE